MSRRGRYVVRGLLLAGTVFTSLLLLGASEAAQAQLLLGGHVVRAADAFDGSYGAGVRAGIDAPALPFDIMASVEYFFPECPAEQEDCGLSGLTIDANFRIPFPLVRPYVSGGLAYRDVSPVTAGSDETVTGIGVGLGLDVALGGVRAFGETRYEFVDAPEKQFLWRLGLLFDVL